LLNQPDLDNLLSNVRYNAGVSAVEGLNPFRRLLETDTDGSTLAFLMREAHGLPDKVRGGIVFVIAEHYFKAGDVASIRVLFANADAETRAGTLNALWGEPAASTELGPGIVALATQAAGDPDAMVRTEACSVLQNQCAWKVDVSSAIQPLTGLLSDPEWRVRHQAAYACGNFAAQKQYKLSAMVRPLTLNLAHENIYVRVASAWALWKLAKRHDIAASIQELARTLTTEDDYDAARKNAAGALLCWAKRGLDNLNHVRTAVSHLDLNSERKEIARFRRELESL
jgi:hypothetical protein